VNAVLIGARGVLLDAPWGGSGDPAEVRRDAVSQQNVFFPDKPKR